MKRMTELWRGFDQPCLFSLHLMRGLVCLLLEELYCKSSSAGVQAHHWIKVALVHDRYRLARGESDQSHSTLAIITRKTHWNWCSSKRRLLVSLNFVFIDYRSLDERIFTLLAGSWFHVPSRLLTSRTAVLGVCVMPWSSHKRVKEIVLILFLTARQTHIINSILVTLQWDLRVRSLIFFEIMSQSTKRTLVPWFGCWYSSQYSSVKHWLDE